MSSPARATGAARVVGAVIRRPDLWLTAVRQVRVLAPDHWWRRPPFLPLPDRDYLRFRMVTAYGGDGTDVGAVRAHDVVTYLHWCRAWPDVMSSGGLQKR